MREVTGSIPVSSRFHLACLLLITGVREEWGFSSVIERAFCMREATGLNPVSSKGNHFSAPADVRTVRMYYSHAWVTAYGKHVLAGGGHMLPRVHRTGTIIGSNSAKERLLSYICMGACIVDD